MDNITMNSFKHQEQVQNLKDSSTCVIFQRKYFLFFAVCILLTFYLSYTSSITWMRPTLVAPARLEKSFADVNSEWIKNAMKTFNPEQMSCHLPILNPFDASVLPFVEMPNPYSCDQDRPIIFTTDLQSNLIRVRNTTLLNYNQCCYQKFERDGGSDLQVKFETNCVRINENITKILDDTEFIRVLCLKIEDGSQNSIWETIDLFGFVHLKPQLEERLANIQNVPTEDVRKINSALEKEKLEKPFVEATRKANVVVLGLDAVSHMNFVRTMPLTYEYITKNLSAHGLFGYTKVGDNTFPNIVPVLAGQSEEELKETCWPNVTTEFDSCPFIWNNYSSQGYRTAYGEDAIWMSGFNYEKRGFNKQPTDYYFNALLNLLENQVGHHPLENTQLCFGPRMGFEVLLDFLKKMAFTMDKSRRYFQFVWATSLFHDFLNEGMRGDKPLLEMLRWFKNGGYFEDTVFILMSDHGRRWGDIRSTLQGRLEERMPFLYFIFPDWFEERYHSAVSNFIQNQNKLTTPFDLHETLLDLISLDNIENIQGRNAMVRNDLPRGISLFLPIPPKRTCKDAGIEEHWCVCRSLKPVQVNNNPLIQEGAQYVVDHINSIFEKFPQCASLSLNKILSAQVFQSSNDQVEDNSERIFGLDDPRLEIQTVTFTITFEVLPSYGTFEATTSRSTDGMWHISSQISRTNLYENQSQCVNEYNVKKFCFCANIFTKYLLN